MLCQLATGSSASRSWFRYTDNLLSQYYLPPVAQLLDHMPRKKAWPSMATSAIDNYRNASLLDECNKKSTMWYLNHARLAIGKVHIAIETS